MPLTPLAPITKEASVLYLHGKDLWLLRRVRNIQSRGVHGQSWICSFGSECLNKSKLQNTEFAMDVGFRCATNSQTRTSLVQRVWIRWIAP